MVDIQRSSWLLQHRSSRASSSKHLSGVCSLLRESVCEVSTGSMNADAWRAALGESILGMTWDFLDEDWFKKVPTSTLNIIDNSNNCEQLRSIIKERILIRAPLLWQWHPYIWRNKRRWRCDNLSCGIADELYYINTVCLSYTCTPLSKMCFNIDPCVKKRWGMWTWSPNISITFRKLRGSCWKSSRKRMLQKIRYSDWSMTFQLVGTSGWM